MKCRVDGVTSCFRFTPWTISFSGACLTMRRRLWFADPRAVLLPLRENRHASGHDNCGDDERDAAPHENGAPRTTIPLRIGDDEKWKNEGSGGMGHGSCHASGSRRFLEYSHALRCRCCVRQCHVTRVSEWHRPDRDCLARTASARRSASDEALIFRDEFPQCRLPFVGGTHSNFVRGNVGALVGGIAGQCDLVGAWNEHVTGDEGGHHSLVVDG